MANLLCCLRKEPSPALLDEDVISPPTSSLRVISREALLTLGSCETLRSSTKSGLRELRHIFGSTSGTTSLDPQGSLRKRSRLKEGTSRLQQVLKQRLSRDSDAYDSIQQRKEKRKAIAGQLRDNLLLGRSGGYGGFDSDAQIITTPSDSQSRKGGTFRLSSNNFSSLVGGLNPSEASNRSKSPVVKAGLVQNTNSQPWNTASGHTSIWEDDVPEESVYIGKGEADANIQLDSIQLIELSAMDMLSKIGNNSPISSVSVHNNISRMLRPETSSAEQAITAKVCEDQSKAASPCFPPYLSSISDPIPRKWRLPIQSRGDLMLGEGRVVASQFTIPDQSAKQSTPQWAPGNCGRTGLLTTAGPFVGRVVYSQAPTAHHAEVCMPAPEERNFGGVDGQDGGHCQDDTLDSENPAVDKPSITKANPIFDIFLRGRQPSGPLPTAASLSKSVGVKEPARKESYGSTRNANLHNCNVPSYDSNTESVLPKYPFTRGSIDMGSSLYTARSKSVGSSPSNSILRMERPRVSKAPQFRISSFTDSTSDSMTSLGDFDPSTLQEEYSTAIAARRGKNDNTSFQSSTDSFRAQELAAVALRILPRPKTESRPTRSRFKEEFEEPPNGIIFAETGLESEISRPLENSQVHRDDGESRTPSEKKPGCVDNFVPEERDVAMEVWEHALQEHVKRMSPGTYKGSKHSLSNIEMATRVASRAYSTAGERSRQSSSQRPGYRTTSGNKRDPRSVKLMPTSAFDTDSGSMTVGESIDSKEKKSAYIESWTKFPSHTRSQRSNSLTSNRDTMSPHAFALSSSSLGDLNSSFLEARKESRSMTFSKTIAKGWERFSQARRPRSSLSSGGPSEYPELAIIPRVSTSFPIDDEHTVGYLATKGNFSDSEESKLEATQRSANAWSKLYSDCVHLPPGTDSEEMLAERRGAHSHPDFVASPAPFLSLRHPGASSGAGRRGSTLEFQEFLTQKETEAREGALMAAKRAWGSETA